MAGNVIIIQSAAEIPHSRSLAEALANLAIAAAKLGAQQHDESLSFPAAPATQKPERISHSGNGVSARNVHRLHAADVDQNCNKLNQ